MRLKNFWNLSGFKEIEKLRKVIIYDQNPRDDWYYSIVEYYYTNEKDMDFYLNFSDGQFEISLFHRVMRQILHGYHEAVPENIPDSSDFKLPHPRVLI